jgi:4-aminobutyrate aminotransferase-like enzyme
VLLLSAAGVATINYILKHDLIGNARTVGAFGLEQLRKLAKKHAIIGDVRGQG